MNRLRQQLRHLLTSWTTNQDTRRHLHHKLNILTNAKIILMQQSNFQNQGDRQRRCVNHKTESDILMSCVISLFKDLLGGVGGVGLTISVNNKNKKVRSFKSNEHIRKKVDGPYFGVSAKKPHQ